MSIERIEKNKARLDIFILIFLVFWIVLRLINYLNIAGLDIVMHFSRLTLAIGAIFLIMPYMYYNSLLNDEFERKIKLQAHKFSWVFTMLVTVLLYILCKKTSLEAEFALELILWLGFMSYFLAFKFLDAGWDTRISEKNKKKIASIAVFLTVFIFGINMGFTIPDLDSEHFVQNKLLYYGLSAFIFIIAVLFLIRFTKAVKEIEKKGENNE